MHSYKITSTFFTASTLHVISKEPHVTKQTCARPGTVEFTSGKFFVFSSYFSFFCGGQRWRRVNSSQQCALVKTAVKLRDKLLEGWCTVQWCCQLLQSVAKSRAEFYFVQCFTQQKKCETTHVTLCNSPATCLAMALRDKLLRKLHSVTGP